MNMNWIQNYFPKYNVLTEFDNIDENGRIEVHGLDDRKNTRCMFCGKPYEVWGKRDVAHAISECVGNKRLINFLECYECNHMFGELAENHLGKYIMPYRVVNGIYGKRPSNTVKDGNASDSIVSYGTFRIDQKKNVPVISTEVLETNSLVIEKSGTGIFTPSQNGGRLTIPRQNYNPKLAYMSLMKMAYSLLPVSVMPKYIRGLISLYTYTANNPLYYINNESTVIDISDQDKERYYSSLPLIGIEITLDNPISAKSINVCLLEGEHISENQPEMLFALQMKSHVIIIPILSDNHINSEENHLSIKCKEESIRKLDFRVVEDKFICDIVGTCIELGPELYDELEQALRDKKLLQ